MPAAKTSTCVSVSHCFFFGHGRGTWKFLDQRLKPSHSSDDAESSTVRPPWDSFCVYVGPTLFDL